MRGSDTRTGELFSYVDLEDRVPAKHPLRVIRRIVNDVLIALDAEFGRSTRRPAVRRLRPSGCCERCCCRRSTPSGRRRS